MAKKNANQNKYKETKKVIVEKDETFDILEDTTTEITEIETKIEEVELSSANRIEDENKQPQTINASTTAFINNKPVNYFGWYWNGTQMDF